MVERTLPGEGLTRWLALGTLAAVGSVVVGALWFHGSDAPLVATRVAGEFWSSAAYRWTTYVGLFAASMTLLLWIMERKLHDPLDTLGAELTALDADGLRQLLIEVGARIDEEVRLGSEISLILDELLRGAILARASDMHLSPSKGRYSATFRVDGQLHDVVRVEASIGERLTARLKVLAALDPYSKEAQDGKLRHQVGGLAFEARVSALPADFGDRVVLRFVPAIEKIPTLAELGIGELVAGELEGILSRSQGVFVVSGPVGSGKTTTLYAALAHIAKTRGHNTSLVTLEDPIERQLPFCTQTQISQKLRRSFAQTLRSVLRQDPNVLMIGEIRDEETAGIAAQAGLTGHLILTTLHVESSAGTFARLLDMKVEPFVLASASAGCLSQRLVRSLCVHCRRTMRPSFAIRAEFERLGVELGDDDYYEALGCVACEQQGYQGRTPIVELLISSPAIRQAVHARKTTREIHELACAEGMMPLVQAGLEKARRGDTSLSEVLRVVG